MLPTPDLFSRSQFITALDANTRKATSGTAVQLGPMEKDGMYYLISDTAAFFLQGAASVAPTTSTGVPIAAGGQVGPIYCDNVTNNGYVGIILASGTGVAYLVKVS